MAELTRVFVYGTLKQGFPNHKLLSKLSKSQIVKFISNAETVEKYPLVTATQAGIPFLLDYAGRGKVMVQNQLIRDLCRLLTGASFDFLYRSNIAANFQATYFFRLLHRIEK